jgi:hypothetical protein
MNQQDTVDSKKQRYHCHDKHSDENVRYVIVHIKAGKGIADQADALHLRREIGVKVVQPGEAILVLRLA